MDDVGASEEWKRVGDDAGILDFVFQNVFLNVTRRPKRRRFRRKKRHHGGGTGDIWGGGPPTANKSSHA